MRTTAAITALILLFAVTAAAHPLDREAYSLRSGLKLGPAGLMAVVVLEKPTQFVLADLRGARDPWTGKRAGEEGEDSAPPRRLGQDEQNAYARRQFEALTDGLSLTVNGQAITQRFTVRNTRINGKAGRGFFVYIVELTVPVQADWGDRVEVVVRNDSFPVEPMFYSGLARAEGRWAVVSDSAADLLGADRGTGQPDDPRSWSKDARLRSLHAVFAAR